MLTSAAPRRAGPAPRGSLPSPLLPRSPIGVIDRIEQHRARHRRRLGIARVDVLGAEDHQLQVDADLRRRQAGAVGGVHGVEHVGDQQVDSSRVECGHGLGHAQQARIAHLEDFTDCHGSRAIARTAQSFHASASRRPIPSEPARAPAVAGRVRWLLEAAGRGEPGAGIIGRLPAGRCRRCRSSCWPPGPPRAARRGCRHWLEHASRVWVRYIRGLAPRRRGAAARPNGRPP